MGKKRNRTDQCFLEQERMLKKSILTRGICGKNETVNFIYYIITLTKLTPKSYNCFFYMTAISINEHIQYRQIVWFVVLKTILLLIRRYSRNLKCLSSSHFYLYYYICSKMLSDYYNLFYLIRGRLCAGKIFKSAFFQIVSWYTITIVLMMPKSVKNQMAHSSIILTANPVHLHVLNWKGKNNTVVAIILNWTPLYTNCMFILFTSCRVFPQVLKSYQTKMSRRVFVSSGA